MFNVYCLSDDILDNVEIRKLWQDNGLPQKDVPKILEQQLI